MICEKLDNFLAIGNVDKGFDYDKIKKIIDVYRDYVINNCGECWARNLCGECFISIAGNKKIDFSDKSKFCETRKMLLYNSMVLYLEIYEQNPEAVEIFNY